MERTPFLKLAAEAFFGRSAHDQISWASAAFSDRALEADYQKDLVRHDLPKERFVNLLGFVTYLSFGVLDVITFDERLTDVLIVRWGVCAPLALLLIFLTYVEKLKPYFQYMTAAGMAVGAMSVVWMISVMPASGGPPYIIGILTIFIFYSCIQRIYFPLAAAVFITTTIAYAATITVVSPKSEMEIASGLFFIMTVATIALATSYTQEIRSRLLWFRNRQRELDAAFIEQLLIEATAADQSKINFLSILSHELRTPLHQIIGFSEIVMNQRDELKAGETQNFLTEIHGSAHALLSRIGKMLRYADATAGKIDYDLEDCPALEIIELVCLQAATKAQAQGVSIEVGAVEKATLRVDAINTAYALGHIVENAIKASKKGQKIVITGAALGEGVYAVEVEDFGVGMSPEKISAAFEPFSQAEALRTRTIGGIGLGLTLARKIFNDQNADITLVSAPGKGTRATILFRPPGEGVKAEGVLRQAGFSATRK